MKKYVDKRERLVQGVCIDSATSGDSLSHPGADGRTKKGHHMKTETKSEPIHARQAIVTRYLCPTNTKPSRIKATCDRASLTITFPQGESIVDAHAVAVRALLAKFAKEDGTERSWPSFERWVCGGMPQSSKDAYVWVQLPDLYRYTFTGRPIGAIGTVWEHTVERYGQSEDAARASLWDTYEHISVTACERVVARSQGGAK